MPLSFTLDPALLFENGKAATAVSPGGGPNYFDVGNGARWKWRTNARQITITGYATQNGLSGTGGYPSSRLGLLVNGKPYWYQAPVGNGASFTTPPLWLPVGTNKIVELLVPSQAAISVGGAPKGVYPATVQFDYDATQISPSLLTNRLIIYGDSIASGGLAVTPALFGYAGLLKADASNGLANRSVTQVSWGFRRLNDDCSSPSAAASFASAIAALQPTEFLSVIGSNDQAVVPEILVATHQTQFGYLLDALHTAMPSLPIIVVSPIRRGSEGANSNGETMAQFRTAQSAVVSARRGIWSVAPTFHDGLAIFSDLTQYAPDQIHPNTAGNVTLYNAIKQWIV